MKYKVGDRLLCKRNYIFIYEGNRCLFIKGQFYNIILISLSGLTFIDEERDSYFFSTEEASDYFYSEIELRKFKLERLNNV